MCVVMLTINGNKICPKYVRENKFENLKGSNKPDDGDNNGYYHDVISG